MNNTLQKQAKEMLNKLSPEAQSQVMALQKTIRDGMKDNDNEILRCKKCLICTKDATRKCTACKTAYFCSRDCEKKSKAEHKKICLNNRILGPETKIPFTNNTIREIVFSEIQNKNICYLCDSKDDLRFYQESVFCKNCLEY